MGALLKPSELLQLRQKYAWDWFQFHANQRTSMFNYFLVAMTILGSAYVGLVKEGIFPAAALLGLVGFLLAISFTILDVRNQQLVKMSEEVLKRLESEDLFKDFDDPNPEIKFGDKVF